MTIYILVNAALGWRTQPESSFFLCIQRSVLYSERMNPEVFSGHPWASSTSYSPVRKEKEVTSNCKTSMTSSCYRMIPVPWKFKPFDQLAVNCCEAEALASNQKWCLYKAAVLRNVLQHVSWRQPELSGGGCMEMGDLPQTCQVPRLRLSHWTEGNMG